MFNTTTGLTQVYNTGDGLSSLQVDSLVNQYNVDLGDIQDIGSSNIIKDEEREQITTNKNNITANTLAITTNQNAINTNSSAILAINNKIAPISYQVLTNSLYVNSNVLLQDPNNAGTKYDLTCDDISCDDIQSDQITANSMITNSIVSDSVNLNTAITSLETKTTNQSFSGNTTSFTNDLSCEKLTINSTNINVGSGSIITTSERDSLGTISDFTKNVLSDTLFIDNHLYIGSVGTQKDITCNNIDCNIINPYNTQTAVLSVAGISFSSTIPSQIATNTANISTNTGNITNNTQNIATNTADISTNLQSITALNFSVSALEGTVTYNSRRQLAQTQIPVYENTSQTSNTDLTTSGNSNSNFELKTQLFDIEINNQSTQLTKNYYVPTNIGNKRIVNLEFIYREVSGSLYRKYPPEFLKYYDSNASSGQQSRILIENIPPSFDIEGVLSIEYIN